jgi:hypothetical protein
MTQEQKDILKQLAQMGDVVYVKQNGSRIGLNEEGKVPLQTQAEAVLYFFQRLDIDMLKLLLDDANTYQNFEKKEFLNKLDLAFDHLLLAGNTYLNTYEGMCNSETCNFKCKGYSFVGNATNDYMDFIFDIRDNRVFDMYECSQFRCDSPPYQVKRYISIDDFEFPF